MNTVITQNINQAKQALLSGEVVAIPTETVYGLAANAFNSDAVIKIFNVKQRPLFNPLIIHTNSLEKLKPLVKNIDSVSKKLAEKYWPGPLTILLPKSDIIHDLVTAGSPLVAVRIPSHPTTLSLLEQLPFPLAAPSANLFGKISPTTATHVMEHFERQIPIILDGGPCAVGLESTIVYPQNDKIEILRKGRIDINQIQESSGLPVTFRTKNENPEAPGMLKSHYAPSAKLIVGSLNDLIIKYRDKRIGILAFGDIPKCKNCVHIEQLSSNMDLTEAAQNLFAALRNLDSSSAELILAPILPDSGIGMAINDRLERASA